MVLSLLGATDSLAWLPTMVFIKFHFVVISDAGVAKKLASQVGKMRPSRLPNMRRLNAGNL